MRLIAEHLFPARKPNGPGALVLHELPGDEPRRYVTHWRNAQDGGLYGGRYHDGYGQALEGFEGRVRDEILDQRYAHGDLPGPFHYELFSDGAEGAAPVAAGLDVGVEGALAQLRYLKGAAGHPLWAVARVTGPDGAAIARELDPLHGAYDLPAGAPGRLELAPVTAPGPEAEEEPEPAAPGLR